MASKDYLGLDLGRAHTGIARASTVAKMAEPLKTVDTADVLKTLQIYSDQHGLEAVVVGLPRNLHGDDTAQTGWVRQWVNEVKNKLNAPFYWQDEALTTRLATAKKNSKIEDVDSLAAAIILQDFLDGAEAERVVC